ncbi:cyclin-dependent protein kinase inhibitor SMR3 [Quercus suber]|uniref:Cyclin-dependent protein kinase inhibitor smr10 n=1 Tax=Quercus suber TaxID=58331 RepID=A0AAW0JFA9_QUESU|nr:cyclin-dependent protein kinase inhibitor SMR3-like [Quercus suber]
MFSGFKSLSFMGVSDSQMFLTEKDLNSMELNFLVRPTLDFQDQCPTAPSEEEEEVHELYKSPEVKEEEKQEEEEEEEDKCKISVSSLEVKVPSLGELRDVEDDDDGFRTPTSLDHKIPESLRCPPAPRKPKPIPSTKRKAGRRRIMLDLSNEIDSLFPPALLVDLRVKIKKIRRGDETK